MNRTHILSLLAAVLLAASVPARERNEERAQTAGCRAAWDGAASRAEGHRLRTWVNKRVERVSRDDVTFTYVLAWLRDQRIEGEPVNIFVMWRALALESIDRDAHVYLELRNVKIKEVLDLVLLQLSDLDPPTSPMTMRSPSGGRN